MSEWLLLYLKSSLMMLHSMHCADGARHSAVLPARPTELRSSCKGAIFTKQFIKKTPALMKEMLYGVAALTQKLEL